MFAARGLVELGFASAVAISDVLVVRLLLLCLHLVGSCGVVVFQCLCLLSVVLLLVHVLLCLATPFAFVGQMVLMVCIFGELCAIAVVAIVVVDVVGSLVRR